MKRPVYLDHHATTPVDPEVFEAMRPYFTEVFGNASSGTHAFGWEAAEAVEEARAEIARSLGARPDEIVFTGGATESNTLAVRGVLGRAEPRRNHLVTVATEHRSVLDTGQALAADGIDLTILPVDREGSIDLDRLRAAITDRTALVSVMAANNEIGTLAPLPEIAALAHARGALFHTDASQMPGHLPIDVDRFDCDLLSLSAHKMYGPKGVGALFVRLRERHVELTPLMHGGGQERGLRPGSLNVPGIVGLGKACALVPARLAHEAPRLRLLRDRLRDRLLAELDGLQVNGPRENRLPNNLSVSIPDVEGEALFLGLRDLALSNGSACHSALRRPSHVLTAIGHSDALAHATLRFGLGRSTTEAEIDYAAERLVHTVRRLRQSLGAAPLIATR